MHELGLSGGMLKSLLRLFWTKNTTILSRVYVYASHWQWHMKSVQAKKISVATMFDVDLPLDYLLITQTLMWFVVVHKYIILCTQHCLLYRVCTTKTNGLILIIENTASNEAEDVMCMVLVHACSLWKDKGSKTTCKNFFPRLLKKKWILLYHK